MKLAFSTLGCPDYTFKEVVEAAFINDIEGIEIRGINGVMNAEEIPELHAKNLNSTMDLLNLKGVKLIGFGTSCNFHDESRIAAAMEEGLKAIDICAAAKIPNIRVFGDTIDRKENRDKIIQNVSCCIGKLCQHNKAVGVIQEIHGSFNTIENILPIIEANRHYENFGILWDIQHSDKIYNDNWQEFYSVIKPYIKRVHIKDYKRKGNLTPVGHGDIPIQSIVRTLISDGYKGYFSFEWEKKWVPELPEFPVGLKSFLQVMKTLEK